jgi:hypothetical protein
VSAEVLSSDEHLVGINVYVEHFAAAGRHSVRDPRAPGASGGVDGVEQHPGRRRRAHLGTAADARTLVTCGVKHTTSASRAAAMRSVYVHPQIPSPWPEPTVVAVIRELLGLLSDVELVGPTRERAESLLLDLLRPVSVHAISLPMPVDPRALEVARHPDQTQRADAACQERSQRRP